MCLQGSVEIAPFSVLLFLLQLTKFSIFAFSPKFCKLSKTLGRLIQAPGTWNVSADRVACKPNMMRLSETHVNLNIYLSAVRGLFAS